MKNILILACVWLLTPVLAHAANYTLNFNGEPYYLAHVEERPNYGLNQYIPMGETLNHWTRMVALHRYDSIRSTPLEFANGVGSTAQLLNADAQFEVIEDPNTKEAIIDFTTFTRTEPLFMEFNVFRFQPNTTGQGLLGYHYAHRLYGADIQKYGDTIGKSRLDWRAQMMAQHQFPAYVTKDQFLHQGNLPAPATGITTP